MSKFFVVFSLIVRSLGGDIRIMQTHNSAKIELLDIC